MKSQNSIREFKVEKAIFNELSEDELKALPILTEATRLVANIYSEQENNDNQSKHFYPIDLTNAQIEEKAKKNPQFFSPYTVVEKSANGIKVIPYHIKYKNNLQKIAKLTKEASLIVKDKNLSNYLGVVGDSLLKGDYKKMDQAWLKTQNSTLQFLVGPYERYLDKRFSIKMAYLAFVGIKDSYYTKKAKEMSEVLFNSLSEKPDSFASMNTVQVCSIHNIIFAGINATALLSTEHIPSDDQTIRESGSRVMSFLSSIDYKFDNLLLPIFQAIFENSFQQSYPEDLLRKGNYYLMLLYGLARQLHRYEGSRSRLKELFPILDESNSIVSGIQQCKHLVLKGVIDQKDLEAMIIMHICWCFSEWIFARTSQIRSDYLRGDAITLNYYFQIGALKQSRGISWPNFSKIFFGIESLSSIFIRILSQGSYEDGENFLNESLSYEIFKSFDSKLSKINFSN
ncbi:MAG TPA: hypothetical protein VLE91_04415 [Candidatus Saccharimonadales bacterium]|nr:hypothetical protein [Candidatus Saccharimonadales bacterium]